jgi:Zn-dependent peptidase ImmA (M78 family)
MLKIPKKINIFGKLSKIEIVKDLRLYGVQKVDGLFCPVTKVISIEAEQTNDAIMQTLVHEFGHAIMNRISLTQSGLSAELEEIIVDSFSTFMNETFKMTFRK